MSGGQSVLKMSLRADDDPFITFDDLFLQKLRSLAREAQSKGHKFTLEARVSLADVGQTTEPILAHRHLPIGVVTDAVEYREKNADIVPAGTEDFNLCTESTSSSAVTTTADVPELCPERSAQIGPFAVGDLVDAFFGGEWHPAKVLGISDDGETVNVLWEQEFSQSVLTLDNIRHRSQDDVVVQVSTSSSSRDVTPQPLLNQPSCHSAQMVSGG